MLNLPVFFLTSLGWKPEHETSFAPYGSLGYLPARVASEHPDLYRLYTPQGERLARLAGKLRHAASAREDLPAVGDWTAIRLTEGDGEAVIEAVLTRRSKFSRKIAGETTCEQVVAANVDTVFLVSSLNRDFNPRRIERYLVMAWESGARPVILLNKADLCPDPSPLVAELGAVAYGVPVHVVSGVTEEGLAALDAYFAPGETVVFLGSSGVGKSTLINRLCGNEVQVTGATREDDDRGRHTTTARELLQLPGGGLVIDTPGMRELQLWEGDQGLLETFPEIEELAAACRFRDCTHSGEPGCAVQQALAEGELAAERFDSFTRLQRELAYLARKEDYLAQVAERDKWKRINKEFRQREHR